MDIDRFRQSLADLKHCIRPYSNKPEHDFKIELYLKEEECQQILDYFEDLCSNTSWIGKENHKFDITPVMRFQFPEIGLVIVNVI